MLRASGDPPLQTGSSEAGESGAGVHSTFPLVRDGTLPPARAPSSTWGPVFSTKTRDLAHRGDLLPPPQEPHVPDHPCLATFLSHASQYVPPLSSSWFHTRLPF